MDRIRKYLQVGALAVALTAPVSVNSHIPPSDSPFKSENTETTEVVEDMNTFTPTHDPVHDVAVLRRQHPEYKGRRGNMMMVDEPEKCWQKIGQAIQYNGKYPDYLEHADFLKLIHQVGPQANQQDYEGLVKFYPELVESAKENVLAKQQLAVAKQENALAKQQLAVAKQELEAVKQVAKFVGIND